MANVNMFELEDCLNTLLPFIGKNPLKPYIKDYGRGVQSSIDSLREIFAETDRQYLEWRNGEATAQTHLKKAHVAYKTAQRRLALLDVDYPTQSVDYLKVEDMERAARAMTAALKAHSASVDGAQELIDTLNTHIDKSARALAESVRARDEYSRAISRRIRAIENAEDTIRFLRVHIRADLGHRHPEYAAIRWPAVLAPDPR